MAERHSLIHCTSRLAARTVTRMAGVLKGTRKLTPTKRPPSAVTDVKCRTLETLDIERRLAALRATRTWYKKA